MCNCCLSSLYLKFVVWERVNSLRNGQMLDKSQLKAFADDKLNVAKMMISVCDRLQNIVGKGENAGYQHFLVFSQPIKTSLSRVMKTLLLHNS